MLRLERVSLVYPTGAERVIALKEVELEVRAGEFLGVIGPSGSGKSSLLYLLSGLRDPSEGRAFFDGVELGRLSRKERGALRRRRMGFVFQQHFLIHYLTCLENVVVGAPALTPAVLDRARALLAAFGLGDKAKRFPYELSVGQRQRVAVARALLHEPDVLFADEPTASLDRAAAGEVVRALEAYHRSGHTVVVVTHDPTILQGATRVVRVWDGRVAEVSAAEQAVEAWVDISSRADLS